MDFKKLAAETSTLPEPKVIYVDRWHYSYPYQFTYPTYTQPSYQQPTFWQYSNSGLNGSAGNSTLTTAVGQLSGLTQSNQ